MYRRFPLLLAFLSLICLSSADARADFTFVHIPDLHLSASAYDAENVTRDTAMFREIRTLTPAPAFALSTGDLTASGSDAEFALLRSTLSEALPIPFYAVPGNQDIRWNPTGKMGFARASGQPLYRSFDHEGVHFILLDSTVSLQHWGHFDLSQLAWLRDDLTKTGRRKPIIVAFHHPIFRTAGAQVDNEQALLNTLAPYNVRLYLMGHGTEEAIWSIGGVPALLSRALYEGAYHLVKVGPQRIDVLRRTPEEPDPQPLVSIPLQRPAAPAWGVGVKVAGGIGKVTVTRQELPPLTRVTFSAGNNAETILEPTSDGWTGTFDVRLLAPGAIPFGTHRVRVNATLPDSRTYQLTVPVTLTAPQAMAPTWQTDLGGEVQARIVTANNTVFIPTVAGELVALDPATGKARWRAKTGGALYGAPCVDANTVYIGSGDGSIYAFDTATGAQRWKTATSGPVFAGAACAGKMLCLASSDRKVYGIEAATGKIVWTKSGDGLFQSRIATDGVRFYVGGWDNYFRCFDAATGAEVWKEKFGDDFRQAPAIGSPTVADGRVFLTTGDGALHALEASTGMPLWRKFDLGVGYSSPLYDQGRVYCTSLDQGRVFCFDAITGEEVWTTATGNRIFDSSCAVARGIVFAGGVNGALVGIRARDGKILWQYRLPLGHLLASPATDTDHVFIGSLNGTAAAFPLVTSYQKGELTPIR